MAFALSPVFELAFDRKPAVNKWPDRDGGPWPDFFQRVALLALGERKTSNLHDVLKQARRMDMFCRVTFSPGQLPEYTP
jgi:hypothetical protein